MELFVMTGAFQTGKTTWIERMLAACGLPVESDNPAATLASAAKDAPRPRHVAGVYTPAVFEGAEKTGIDAVLLPECVRFGFAVRRTGCDADGVRKLGWDFSQEALARINERLSRPDVRACDLLVVDELGPMELLRDEGYTAALRLLDERAVDRALLVVRPSLLEAARARWGDFETLAPDASVEGFLERAAR